MPATQSLQLVSPTRVDYTLVANDSGRNWLFPFPASGSIDGSGSLVNVIVNPLGLSAGTYNGTIQAVAGGVVRATLPVTLIVTGVVSFFSTASVSGGPIGFDVPAGSTTIQQSTLSLRPNGPRNFTVTCASTGNWLSATPAQGTALSDSAPITVYANPNGLANGIYRGTVTVLVPGQSQIVTGVTMTVGPSVPLTGLSVSPRSISFTSGSAPQSSQTLEIRTPTPTVYYATVKGITTVEPWLNVVLGYGRTEVQSSGGAPRALQGVGLRAGNLPPGTYTATIVVGASGFDPISIPVTITIVQPLGPLSFLSPSALSSGRLHQNYSGGLFAQGGSSRGYTFTLLSGAMPPGLSLSNSTSYDAGLITGKPTSPGAFEFAVKVIDSAGNSATQSFVMSVVNELFLPPFLLPGGVVGNSYSAVVPPSGGEPPYTFIASGLPDGLTLDAATGVISGVPTLSDTFYPTITVRDSLNRSDARLFPIVIQRPQAQLPKLSYVPITPCRIMETRPEYNYQGRTGDFGPPTMLSYEKRTLTLQASNVCQLPASARAVVVNITLIPHAGGQAVILYPADTQRTQLQSVRAAGQIVANSGIVRVGSGGTLKVYSEGTSDVLIDIYGYFTDSNTTSNLVFYPITPCRAIETRIDYRSPAGPFGPPTINNQETRRFRLRESPSCSIPANAAAYSATVTVVPPAALAYLTAWPAAAPQPNISSINSFAGRVLANNLIIPAGPDGAIDVFASDRTDMIVDINGYFAPDDGVNGLFYYPLVQCRVADSSSDAYPVPFGMPAYTDESTRRLPVRNSPQCVSIPSSAKAYALNFTALPNGSPMPFLTAYPAGQGRPNASILNAFQGQVVTNSALIPAGTDGAIDVFAFRRTDVVVDISGYFAR
jgi:hypothetical protein